VNSSLIRMGARRFNEFAAAHRACGPAREEEECGMMVDAGFDDTRHDPGDRAAAGRDEPDLSAAESGAGTTGELPDPRKLAEDWIILWQSELSAMAADPEMRESWQTLMALWAGTMSAMLRGLPRGGTADWRGNPAADRYERTGRQTRAADAPRSTPADAAPDARDAEIERLARNVAALERRLADLEHGGDPPVHPKRRPRRKPRT
jgi:hypothetical protein